MSSLNQNCQSHINMHFIIPHSSVISRVFRPWGAVTIQTVGVTEFSHYDDVIMTTIASQITSLMSVYSTVYSGADQRRHQSSASLAFVWGIHRDRWILRTKGQLRGKCFHLMTSSWAIWLAVPSVKNMGQLGIWSLPRKKSAFVWNKLFGANKFLSKKRQNSESLIDKVYIDSLEIYDNMKIFVLFNLKLFYTEKVYNNPIVFLDQYTRVVWVSIFKDETFAIFAMPVATAGDQYDVTKWTPLLSP